MGSLRSLYGFCFLLILLCSNNFAASEESDDDDLDDGVVAEEIDLDDLGSVNYTSPSADPERYHFSEHFDDIKSFKKKWVLSEAKKDGADESIAKYDGEWAVEAPVRKILLNDLGLVLKSKAKHAAIAARLNKPFVFNKVPLVVQYEVTLQEGQQCGGAYIKLLSTGQGTKNLKEFYDKTPYTIMFGPDKCGNDHKLHFIFRHKNPLNGTIEEKHSKKAKSRLDSFFTDSRPHLYTLILKPNNEFQIFVDNKEVNSGSLLQDFTPAVNPPETIDDPEDRKPLDWDERESIPDPNDSKPADWDETAPEEIVDPNAVKPDGWLDNEPLTIPDSAAVRPKDWDDEMDGEWEAPLIDNPKCASAPGCDKWTAPRIANPAYKGVWRPQLITNPNYKGKWKPRTISNPDYYKDDHPFRMTSIDAVGIELWSMSPNILFDNIVITDDPIAASEWALKTFSIKMSKLTKNEVSLWGRIMKSLNYKPEWWGVYFVYCSIPIVAYVWFLCKRSREESVIDWVLNVTNEHPWLWAVYIILIAFISGLTLYLCCFRNSEGKESSDENTKDEITKKTDAVTEDSPTPLEEIPNEAADNKELSEEEEGEIEETSANRPSKQDLEEHVSENDEAEIAPELVGSGDAPRKRKPRKE